MQMTQEHYTSCKLARCPVRPCGNFGATMGILASQRLPAGSEIRIAYGTDCGMSPWSRGILEFQAMVNAGLGPCELYSRKECRG